jgi:hypothetical protein
MDFRTAAIAEITPHLGSLGAKHALLGFDGFVDTIVTPVRLRHGLGENFEPIPTLTDFAQRIASAAGKSTNIELFPRLEKLGGNGPIMGQALLSAGAQVRYIGTLGHPTPHPVFRDFAARTQAVSLTSPAQTTAVEFDDGKLMLGMMSSLDEVTCARIIERMGEGALCELLARSDLVALVNWTMLPHMTAILTELVDRLLPKLPARDRLFFFDLADPEKRSDSDLHAALLTMARFGRLGRAILGLNLKEAQHVHRLLGFSAVGETEAGVKDMAQAIRERLDFSVVVVHPRNSAGCATRDGAWWVPGPYVEKPLITTGAGDHFNAGFASAQLLGLSPLSSLALAVATSGFYVRTARSPSLPETLGLLQSWM